MKNRKLLTWIKIIVCSAFLFCVPYCTHLLTSIAESRTIAMTVSISTAAMFLILFNHQLAALHFKRFTSNLKENMVYVFFSALFVCAVFVLSNHFFSFSAETVDLDIVRKYPFFAPLIMITYTFSYSFCFNIVFKLITDQIPMHDNPLVTILISAFLFSLYLSCSQFALVPLLTDSFNSVFFFQGWGVNFMISLCCSYCYNQTSSLVSMTLGLTLASFIMILV